jgi:hypothetical protein
VPVVEFMPRRVAPGDGGRAADQFVRNTRLRVPPWIFPAEQPASDTRPDRRSGGLQATAVPARDTVELLEHGLCAARHDRDPGVGTVICRFPQPARVRATANA